MRGDESFDPAFLESLLKKHKETLALFERYAAMSDWQRDIPPDETDWESAFGYLSAWQSVPRLKRVEAIRHASLGDQVAACEAGGADWLHVVAFGVALAAMNTLFYHAIDRIPLGIAVTFEVLGPLTVYVLLGRRVLTAVWALLALVGIYLLGGASVTELDPVGVALAVGAGAAWAAYIVFGARVARAFTGAEGLALALGVGAMLTVPLGWASAGATLLDPRVLGIGIGVALLSSVVPYSLEMAALRRVSAANFAVMVSLYPLTAALAGFLVLGQRLTAVDLLAMVLVAAAVAGATLTGAPRPPRLEKPANPSKGG